MNKVNSGRLHYIDIAKALCMLLVIWMHCVNCIGRTEFTDIVNCRISTMYMPCFFILSGMFIRTIDIKTVAKKRIKSLLIPFAFTYVLSFGIGLVIDMIHPGLLKNEVDFFAIVKSSNFTNGPIWFLLVLFNSLLVLSVLLKIHNSVIRTSSVLLFSLMGFYWRCIFAHRLPFFLDTSLTALFYLYIGKLIYDYQVVKRIAGGGNFCVISVLVITFAIIVLFPTPISMQGNGYNINVLRVIVTSISGSLSLILCAYILPKNYLLEYFGSNTLIVLCFHMFVIMGLSVMIKQFDVHGNFAVVLCFLSGWLLLYPIIFVVKKHLNIIFP